MKKTLFGGMKIKGPSGGKAQQPKDKTVQLQTSPNNEIQQQKQQLAVLNMSKAQTQQSPMTNIPQAKPELRHERTSLQAVLKEEQPIMQRKKSMKQEQAKRISNTELNNKSNAQQQYSKNSKLIRNDQQGSEKSYPQEDRKGVMKDVSVHKKSFSEKNYHEDSEGKEEERDKSVVVGNYRTDGEKQQMMLKTSYKSAKPAPKSNPILNQLKKVNKNNKKQKDLGENEKQKQKDNTRKVIGPSSSSSKQPPNKPLKRQRSSVMQQLSSSHLRVIQSMMQKKQTRQQIVSISCSMMQLKQKLSILTNKQNQCVAMQDYQQADKLQQQIQSISSRIGEQQIEVNFTQQTLNQLQHQSINLLKSHLEEEKRTIRRIKLVQLDVEDEISHYKRQQQARISQCQVLSQQQGKKLANVTNDLKRQNQMYKQYEINLNNQLNLKKQPLQKLLTQQQQKKNQLQQSIKELEEKLKKKKTQLKTTLSSIQTTTNKLNQIDQQYHNQKQTLQSKQTQIHKLQHDKLTHTNKLKQIQTQITKMETLKNTQINSMTIEKQSYHKLSTDLQHFFQTTDIEYYIKQKKTLTEEYIKHSAELKRFEDSHKEKRQRVKELEFQKASLQSQTNKKQQKIKQLKSKIPLLEKDQKQFTIFKNFKAAAMKKAEIQQCQQQINRIKKGIQQSFGRQAQLEMQIQEIRKQQQEHVEEENRLRKQMAMSQYRLGLQKRSQIIKQLQWLRGLEVDNKGRVMYEGKLAEQLQSLQQELNYIAQEYEIKQQEQVQVLKHDESNGKKSEKLRNNNKQQQKDKTTNNNQQTFTQHQTYIPLALNENEEGVAELNQQVENTSSKKHIQSSQHSSEEDHRQEQYQEEEELQQQEVHYNQLSQQHEQQQQVEEQQVSSSQHQDQEQPVYEPLSIDEEDGVNQHTNDNQLQQSEQSGKNQHEQSENYQQKQHGRREEQEQIGGYVPLQLD